MASKALTRPLAVVAFASTLLLGATPAFAVATHAKTHGGGGGGGGGTGGTGGTSNTGIDVSYPQCGASLPSGEAFAIVGVNGGLANNYNSCLNSQFTYAQKSTAVTKQAPAQLYVNTADPGNGVGDWPSPSQLGAYNSTSTPSGTCTFANGTSGAGANSPGCAYIYGYDMVSGIRYGTSNVIGDVQAFKNATGATLTNYPVWLDVETGNSWQSASTTGGLAMNIADLQGMVDALNAAAVTASGTNAKQVGIYSTGYQWSQITGTPTATAAGNLSGLPDWIPGASTQSGAVSNCSQTAFTAGLVTITQWAASLDGDYSCIG